MTDCTYDTTHDLTPHQNTEKLNSATDPVAVVAILKELGIAESVSILIDGVCALRALRAFRVSC